MKRYIAFFSLLLFAACSGSGDSDRKNGYSTELKTKEDSLFHQVMAGHDAAMAKTGKLIAAKNEVAHRLDSLKTKAAGNLTLSLKTIQKNLDSAEQAMNVWMNEFKVDTLEDDVPAREKYLQLEKEKVERVRDAINNSLSRADSVLRK